MQNADWPKYPKLELFAQITEISNLKVLTVWSVFPSDCEIRFLLWIHHGSIEPLDTSYYTCQPAFPVHLDCKAY